MRFPFWVAGGSWLLIVACATSSGPPKGPAVPGSQQPAEPDEPEPVGIEGGIKAIHDTVRDANLAVEGKHFGEATQLVKKAERAIQKASDVTRSHPEFEDTAEMVQRARHNLDEAVDQDRQTKRSQAIAELTREGTEAVSRGNNIVQQLKVRVGTDEDVENLREIVTVLTNLKDKGTPFVDDPAFGAHTIARDRQADSLQTLALRTKWQIRASAGLDHPMEEGVRADQAAQKAGTDAEKITLLRAAADSFTQCANIVADLETQPLYVPDLLAQTPLGTAPMGSIKAACAKRAAQLRATADGFNWQGQVASLVADVKKAMEDYRNIQDPGQAVKIAETTVAALTTCRATSAQLMRNPVADPNYALSGAPLGASTMPALAEACEREGARINQTMPGLTWRIELEKARDRANQAHASRQSAATAESAKKQVELYGTALGGMQECAERLATLKKSPKAQANLKIPSAFGEVNLAALEKICKQEAKTIEQLLPDAQLAQKLEEFIATCSGDEVEVARREGVPTRVDGLPNGRVFVYVASRTAKKRGPERRFAFDASGKRIAETNPKAGASKK